MERASNVKSMAAQKKSTIAPLSSRCHSLVAKFVADEGVRLSCQMAKLHQRMFSDHICSIEVSVPARTDFEL